MGIVGATALLAVPSESAAAPFQVVQPPTCPTMQEVTWGYNVSAAGAADYGWMLPDSPFLRNEYINSLNSVTVIAANELVNTFGVRVNTFEMEKDWDALDLALGSAAQIHLTGGSGWGNPISGWFDLNNININSVPDGWPWLHLYADETGPFDGVYLDRARVCSNNPNATLTNASRWVTPGTRASGVLLGSGDVVYFSTSVGSTKAGDTCSSAHDTFALWGAAGNDFDLYVRCNAIPTETQYDYRGYSGDAQEFVHATTANCPCGSTWYIAVHAYNGSGWFNLVTHKHYASEHRDTAYVNATTEGGCTISDGTMADYQEQAGIGFKYFFGANEGARYWDHVVLRKDTEGEVLIYGCYTGRPHSDVCGGWWECFWNGCYATLYKDWYDGPTMAHEMGHHLNCLNDEYEDNVGTECGHSIMGSQFYTNTNYCWCNNQPSGQNRCAVNAGDHGWDQTPPNITALKTGTAWINLQSRSPVTVDSTPDNYDYTQFDFNYLYGDVIRQ